MTIYLELALVALITAGVTVIALVVWARFSPDPDQAIHGMLRQAEGQTIFLFDGTDLVDCTPPARNLWEGLARGGTDLQRLFRGLQVRFSNLPQAENVNPDAFEGEFQPSDPTDPLQLKFESWNGYLRATLADADSSPMNTSIGDEFPFPASEELKMLRSVTDEAPILMWQTNTAGTIEWANEAYFAQLAEHGDYEANHWPPAALFPELHVEPMSPSQPRRVELGKEKSRKVFDVTNVERGGLKLFFAQPADAVEKAERTQREFVQTLTKTFAQLSIGLAIFDQRRRLVLFNPALLNLIRLPADFLVQKPTLHGFLDRLREEKVIAEPKDYRSWRKHLVELEARASDGTYCETWNLPGGLTFRVTGRPHPNGAIAFLFEDISAEMSLTRRFHAQIEAGQSALDAVNEAIIVVNSLGLTTLTNAAYRKLFDECKQEALTPQRLHDHFEIWSNLASHTKELEALKSALDQKSDRSSWNGQIHAKDGRTLTCRMQRLGNGETLIGFEASEPVTISFRALRRERHRTLHLGANGISAQSKAS